MNGRLWTAEELALLRSVYPSNSTASLVPVFRRQASSIYNGAHKLGLKKTAAFLASVASGRPCKGSAHDGRGAAFRFQPGQIPANKGLRRPGWAPGRMRETQFKKGERSGIAARLWRPIGTILSDSDGYRRIKVREAVYGKEPTGFGNVRVWPLLQRHVWEQAKGPIPPNCVIAFIDRDRSNCAIENLECVTRAEMAYRNRMWGRMPDDLAAAIQLNGALKRKLRRLSNEEQNVGSSQPSL